MRFARRNSRRMSRMTRNRCTLGALVLAAALAGSPAPALAAQDPVGLPLAPPPPREGFVAPYFDGWIQHEDGSRTFSFGFLNRNTDPDAVIEIPIGPDNAIEPARFDGMQPEHFPVVSYGGFSGPRERGVFAVTVPADFQGDVVWTLRSPNGYVASVPGRARSVAYELGTTPQAAGSQRPFVRFSPNGAAGWGPKGIVMDEILATRVGAPLTITIWGEDRGERAPTPLSMTWQKHQGPVGGVVEFEPASLRMPDEGEGANEGTTTVSFSAPGSYVLRVRVDNFTMGDSSFGNMCCWSNGYVRVNVTP
jgi:hypothetical protein